MDFRRFFAGVRTQRRDRQQLLGVAAISRGRTPEVYDWSNVKTFLPYIVRVEALADSSKLILVKRAGTAPAAIAADECLRTKPGSFVSTTNPSTKPPTDDAKPNQRTNRRNLDEGKIVFMYDKVP